MKRYIIALNVNEARELPEAAEHIRLFSEAIGTPSEMEIQVSINPLLTQAEQTESIGFVTEGVCEEYYEEDGE